MAHCFAISRDGAFEVEGHSYLIPAEFSAREAYSYRRLIEPIPDIPGGTSLNPEQRRHQRAYFLRRAAACIIPGLQARSLDGLKLGQLQNMHEWIVAHRPTLSEAGQLPV